MKINKIEVENEDEHLNEKETKKRKMKMMEYDLMKKRSNVEK